MSIYTPDGEEIPRLDLTPEVLLDRSIVLFGPSNTGKTLITKHILNVLDEKVDQILLISPTEAANPQFRSMVPLPLTFYDMSAPNPKGPRRPRIRGPKGAEMFLKLILERQSMQVNMYECANNMATLKRLAKRLSPESRANCQQEIDKAMGARDRCVRRMTSACGEDRDGLKKRMEKAEEKYQNFCKEVIKKHLDREFKSIMAKRLSDEEKQAMSNLHMNPRMVIIFDDCASELKPLLSKEDFTKIFYRGRHAKITSIFTFQDDTDIRNSGVRKNAFVSIFTSDRVCSAYFNRTSNQFSKEERRMVDEMIPVVYNEEEDKYRKMVYVRDDPSRIHFYHFTSPIPQERLFVSGPVQDLCKKVEKTGAQLDTNNPFYEDYRVN